MSWIKKRSLLATEAIQFNRWPCIKLDNLWETLHKSFNSAQNCQVNISLLNEISNKEMTTWVSFSKKKIFSIIKNCNNLSTPGPDKLFWRYLKKIIKDKEYNFKMLSTVIIPKPNKVSYDLPKSFWPIVLLNTTSKLSEKMIEERLQFSMIPNNFIHLCQLGGLKHKSTSDVGITLTYFIRSGWVKNLIMSMLAFNITQFFSLLNH